MVFSLFFVALPQNQCKPMHQNQPRYFIVTNIVTQLDHWIFFPSYLALNHFWLFNKKLNPFLKDKTPSTEDIQKNTLPISKATPRGNCFEQ